MRDDLGGEDLDVDGTLARCVTKIPDDAIAVLQATLMLEGGADIRLIQEILGHAEMSTTEIYTRVSIKHLRAVHERTHPGASLERRRGAEPES